jgi:hypothetical protein
VGAQQAPVVIHFAVQVSGKPFACGEAYEGIGITKNPACAILAVFHGRRSNRN